MSTVSLRHVEWRISRFDGRWEVVRRENSWPTVVGRYPTLEQAHEAAENDRATVLADPMVTEFKPLEVRIKRA
uniref:hypothetical protein n=1 Tax=Nitrospira cf. moscoviensis SBR1015 TaxID=96242 RepID=UPI000B3BD244|nr:hypothetical protein [Nitrospira cf. moscoviensis SBR1015]